MHFCFFNVLLTAFVDCRIGSVGQDTQLCLWDLTEDILRQPSAGQRHRNSTIISIGTDQVFDKHDNRVMNLLFQLGLHPLFHYHRIEDQRFRLGKINYGVGFQMISPSSSETGKMLNSDMKDHHHKRKKLHKRGFSFGVKLGGSSHDRYVVICTMICSYSAFIVLLGRSGNPPRRSLGCGNGSHFQTSRVFKVTKRKWSVKGHCNTVCFAWQFFL